MLHQTLLEQQEVLAEAMAQQDLLEQHHLKLVTIQTVDQHLFQVDQIQTMLIHFTQQVVEAVAVVVVHGRVMELIH
jgi:hypothetical protein